MDDCNFLFLKDKKPEFYKRCCFDIDYAIAEENYENAISNSRKVLEMILKPKDDENLDKKIKSQKYETDLIELIKDNYVILITASPYSTSYDSLKHIEENTDLKIAESYWNFGKRPPALKKYWLEKAVLPSHGNNPNKYLAIESNPKTREMYAEFGIEARPKEDFI